MAKRLSDHPTLEELNDFFGHDRFAEHAGCRIVEGSRDHAVCELDIKDHHRNALGNVMGGAIFTLADFALAIASNTGENPSVSVSSTHRISQRLEGGAPHCHLQRGQVRPPPRLLHHRHHRRHGPPHSESRRHRLPRERVRTAKGPQPGPFSIMKEGVLLDDP